MKYFTVRCPVQIIRHRLPFRIFQWYSTQKNSIKSYDEILADMEKRLKDRKANSKKKTKVPDVSRQRLRFERYEPLKCGDLVLMNLEPFVVIKTPESPLQDYQIADRVGKAREVPISAIDARLFSLLKEEHFLHDNIFAEEEQITASLNIEKDQQTELSSQPMVRVVNHWLYDLISKPITSVYEKALKLALKSFPRVSSTLQELRRDNESVIMPYSEFVKKCLRRDMTVLDYYAVAICLDHALLQPTRNLKLSYTGVDAIQLLSRNSEKRNIDTLKSTKNTLSANKDFLLDYAYQNLPNGECESRAVEILRRTYTNLSFIDSSVASELLSKDIFYRGNNWYKWVFDSARDTENNDIKVLSPYVRASNGDNLKHKRKDFNETVYCIDELGSHEIDDGVSVKDLGNNNVQVGVHIANPTSAINLRNEIHNILPHCSSVYLHDMTFKLLPEEFTTKFSLAEGQKKPTISLFVDLNTETGDVSNVQVKALTPTKIKCIEPAKFNSENVENYNLYIKAAKALFNRRLKNGMITFKDYLNPNLSSEELAFQVPGKGITTEFMILANNMAAEFATRNNIPLIFRSQHLQLTSSEIQKEFHNSVTKNAGLIDFSWMSTIRRSYACVEPGPHSAMGVDVATRFTSPLRRLEDLLTHHQLECYLLNDENEIFSNIELESMCERLLLSEGTVKEIHRNDAMYASLKTLSPETEVLGIVFSIGQYLNTKIYLPEFKFSATYVGEKVLEPFSTHNFKIGKVSPKGGYATVY